MLGSLLKVSPLRARQRGRFNQVRGRWILRSWSPWVARYDPSGYCPLCWWTRRLTFRTNSSASPGV